MKNKGVPTHSIETKNPREAAFIAVLASLREETFITETLARWRESKSPPILDYNLAQEIAYGSARMALALDYIAEQLSDKEKLKLKMREKVLLRNAIYQHVYMDRIPIYAITNETIDIAKKYCHQTFVKFLNAILRRLSESVPSLPKGETVPDLSIRFSYPSFYVQELIQNHGLEKAQEIMEAGNKPSPVMFRIRPQSEESLEGVEGIELIAGTPSRVGIIRDIALLPKIASSPDYYIQNITPALLIEHMSRNMEEPKKILDLCASPGGKLIAVHDTFPDAELIGNDVSPEKLKPLSENIEKYGIKATLSCSFGQEYTSEEKFDLIVLDVPCSNSGVLNKRPEARWRLSAKELEHLEELQVSLLKHALTLLSDEGEIWYMTCSILKRENNRLIDKACEELDLVSRTMETILPNLDGWDGGFAAPLKRKM